MVYRPLREKTLDTLKREADYLLKSTGYEEISLSSLSTSDYRELPELMDYLLDICPQSGVNISLPSLRIDSLFSGYDGTGAGCKEKQSDVCS